jgi:hypothetical protein
MAKMLAALFLFPVTMVGRRGARGAARPAGAWPQLVHCGWRWFSDGGKRQFAATDGFIPAKSETVKAGQTNC